jgi:hypothetical protein
MEDTKAVEFFEGVLSKTRARRIRWQPTAENSEYIAAIGGQFTLSICEYESRDPFSPSPDYALVLKDQDGRELMRVTNLYGGVQQKDIAELYEMARSHALLIDEKIDKVLGELSKL